MTERRPPISSAVRHVIPILGRVIPILGIASILLAMGRSPGGANVLLESAILIHVQHVGSPCETTVQDCYDVIRTTMEGGQLAFQFFVYPLAHDSSGAIEHGQSSSRSWS